MDYFDSLHEEITLSILARLPAESVLDCKLVCPSWRRLVRHPSFSKLHLHHLNHPSTVDDSRKLGFLSLTSNGYQEKFHYFETTHESITPVQTITRINLTPPIKYVSFVGSCNGLICVAGCIHQSICICNPITREYVMLPETKIKRDIFMYTDSMYSFGYVSSTNDYKVIEAFDSKTHVEVHIYTLGSGTGWRNLGNFSFGTTGARGIFANGALYWLDSKLRTIHTFDLAEEKFCENLSSPPLPPDSRWVDCELGVLDGFLYFASERDRFQDIWLLRKKNDNHEMKERQEHQSLGWNKEIRVDSSRLLAVTKSDGVLTYLGHHLSIYDTKTSTSKKLVIFKNWGSQVSPHKNTFVSLKELGEEDTKTMESVEIEETRSRDYPLKQLQEDAKPEYVYL